jgi:hypothetical protein
MGLSTGGLAFKPTSSTPAEPELLHRIFGEAFEAIPTSDDPNSDANRVARKVSTESKDGAIFIYSDELVERLLFKQAPIGPSLFAALGKPEVAVVFCHYDSGDSFGYRIMENGEFVRSRLYVQGETSDEGSPKEFERAWLNAEQYFEDEEDESSLCYRNLESGVVSHEGGVTSRLLELAVKSLIGVCPWDDWNYKSEFRHYRRMPPVTPPAARKAWWRFW